MIGYAWYKKRLVEAEREGEESVAVTKTRPGGEAHKNAEKTTEEKIKQNDEENVGLPDANDKVGDQQADEKKDVSNENISKQQADNENPPAQAEE